MFSIYMESTSNEKNIQVSRGHKTLTLKLFQVKEKHYFIIFYKKKYILYPQLS